MPSPRGTQWRTAEYSFLDNFTPTRLMPGRRWPQATAPATRIMPSRKGYLALSLTNARAHDVIGAIVAGSTTVGD